MVHIDEPGTIRNCQFVNKHNGIYANHPGILLVEDCLFDGADYDPGNFGIYSESWANVTLRRCTFVNHTRSAMLVSGEMMRLEDCVLAETMGHGIEFTDGVLGGTGNVITSESIVLATMYGEFVGFRDNHFEESGDGMLVVSYATWGWGARTLDLEYNWWGTDDAAEIAALIHDSQDDPAIDETVDFLPYHGQPVPTEQRTLSKLRCLFH